MKTLILLFAIQPWWFGFADMISYGQFLSANQKTIEQN